MKKLEILKKLKENGPVAVLRSEDDESIYRETKEVIKGGIKSIELTFTTPYVENAIEKLSKEYANNKDVLIGAGTVLDEITARLAIIKGAKFIVSPSFDKKISKICNLYSIPYLPGCGSVTEIKMALESGCDVIKLFPGSNFGPSFIKDVKGPLPYAQIMPSGGVSLDNMKEWMKYGALTVSIGSALTKDKEKIKETTEKYVEEFNKI